MTVTSLPLTSVTAEDIKAGLVTQLKNWFPDWTDTADSNSMIAILETIGGLAEMLYALQNRMARECFIQYAIDPRNVDAHARGMGYIPQYMTASTVDATLSVPKAVSGDTAILAGSKVSTLLPGIVYELVADAVIKQGTTSIGPVSLKQQESWVQEFTGTGEANTQVTLNQSKVMPATIQVYVNGVLWTSVEHFVDSGPTDKHYIAQVSTTDYTVTLIFGDGVCGLVPPLSTAGQVKFKSGGGKAGTIPSHYLQQVTTEVRDGGSNVLLTVSADNDYAAAPGGDAETTDQIRKHAPSYMKAPHVLFSLEDIEAAVESLPGVRAVKAVNWEILPALPHYVIELFILPDTSTNGDIEPSPALKEAIVAYLTDTRPIVMGSKPMVAGAAYRDLDFNIQLHVQDNYSTTTVKQTITTLINDLFNPDLTNIWDFKPVFGMSVYTSRLIAILQSVAGVRNLVLVTPGNMNLEVNEFPRVSSVTYTAID